MRNIQSEAFCFSFNAGTFSGAIFSLHIFRKSFAQRIYYIEIHLMLQYIYFW